jgi:hypothetical protein
MSHILLNNKHMETSSIDTTQIQDTDNGKLEIIKWIYDNTVTDNQIILT